MSRLTRTKAPQIPTKPWKGVETKGIRTLFADETVVPVVRVVRVTQAAMGVLKLQKLVAVLARVPRAAEP